MIINSIMIIVELLSFATNSQKLSLSPPLAMITLVNSCSFIDSKIFIAALITEL